MSASTIQPAINFGYAQAASVLGTSYTQYRAKDGTTPIATANLIATLNAWITTDAALKGTAPMQFGKPQWYGSVDRSTIALGDFLAGIEGTFFVSSIDYPGPIGLIYCNRTLQIAAPMDRFKVGANPQRWGTAVQTPIPYMVGWPAYVAQLGSGSKMGSTGMNLPSDAKLPGAQVLLSGAAPNLRFNDIITDDFGQSYTISSPEKTTLGWRITAEMWPPG